MVGKVDDLELAEDAEGRLYLAVILVGPAALGIRMGGRLGALLVRLQRRWHRAQIGPARIPFEEVADIGSAVRLGTRRRVHGLEDWVRRRLVARIPGADVDSDE